MFKKTPPPFVPSPKKGEIIPALENTEAHFKIYIDIRKLMAEDSMYRRTRQWEMVKWVSTVLLAVAAGMFAYLAKGSGHMPMHLGMITGLMTVAIWFLAVLRILHDVGQQAALSKSMGELDAMFGIRFPDGKLGARIQAWCDKKDHDWGTAHLLCPIICDIDHPKKSGGFSFIVKCYLSWITLLLLFTLYLVAAASDLSAL